MPFYSVFLQKLPESSSSLSLSSGSISRVKRLKCPLSKFTNRVQLPSSFKKIRSTERR